MRENSIQSQRMQGQELLYVLPLFLALFALTLSVGQPSVSLLPGAAGSSDIAYNSLPLFTVLYILAFVMLLRRPAASWRVLTTHWSYLAFITYIILSSLWSAYPIELLKKSTHYIGILLICAAASVALARKEKSMLRIFVAYTSIAMIVCIATVLIAPSRGIDEALSRRWRGLTYHPNVLGSVAMIAVWANVNYLFYTTRFKEQIWSVIVIGLAGLCLYGSNSITSTVLSVLLVVVVPMMMWVGKRSIARTILIVGAIAMSTLLVLAMSTDQSLHSVDVADEFFAVTGRDKNFTGRTGLWEMAWSAFKQKPLLGWSFDDLMSFLPIRNLRVSQFHNGYLDLLVRGGIIGWGFMGYLIIRKYVLLARLARINWRLFITLASLSTTILAFNITEATLVRGQHLVWLLFIFVLFSLNHVNLGWSGSDESIEDEYVNAR
jgi:exopolysaccharide production protein ExoQ